MRVEGTKVRRESAMSKRSAILGAHTTPRPRGAEEGAAAGSKEDSRVVRLTL